MLFAYPFFRPHPGLRAPVAHVESTGNPMTDFPNHDVEPADTAPLLWWVLGLLGAALVLEFFVAVPWTEPLTDPDTWVLFGVFLGFALRLAGRQLSRRAYRGERVLRWASLGVWAAAAGGGLLVWLL